MQPKYLKRPRNQKYTIKPKKTQNLAQQTIPSCRPPTADQPQSQANHHHPRQTTTIRTHHQQHNPPPPNRIKKSKTTRVPNKRRYTPLPDAATIAVRPNRTHSVVSRLVACEPYPSSPTITSCR